jgi:hypothetical protein
MAEWDFVQNLSYRRHLSEKEAIFVKLMYTSKLKKVRIGKMAEAEGTS